MIDFLNLLNKGDSALKKTKGNKKVKGSIIDDFLIRIQLITVVSGSYVIFRLYLTKQQSFLTFKIKITTFEKLFSVLQKTKDTIDKRSSK